MKISTTILIASFALVAPSFAIPVFAIQTSNATQETAEQSSTGADKKLASDSNWVKVEPTNARASIEMPVKPRFVQRSFTPVKNQPPITVNLHIGSVKGTATTMVFGYNDLATKPKTEDETSKVLDGAVRGSVTNVLGQLQSDPIKITYGKHMGRQFVYACVQSDQKFICTSRVFVVDDRQYQITAVMGHEVFEETIAARFLNSFRLVKPEEATDGSQTKANASGSSK